MTETVSLCVPFLYVKISIMRKICLISVPGWERFFYVYSEVITVAGNPKCHRYKEITPDDNPNCINCHNWRGTKCEFHDQLGDEDTREIERPMMHDGYRRSGGAVRQIRRGT